MLSTFNDLFLNGSGEGREGGGVLASAWINESRGYVPTYFREARTKEYKGVGELCLASTLLDMV